MFISELPAVSRLRVCLVPAAIGVLARCDSGDQGGF
ncbi:hypothetical protein C8K61_11757 [Pseudomonas sp. GV071]|jgi:hypothetical protein|nr:hypothetical protein C8K61_11757 [Pseudomonas sp. GV071]